MNNTTLTLKPNQRVRGRLRHMDGKQAFAVAATLLITWLAPVDRPAAARDGAATDARVWTDVQGRTVEATAVAADGDSVVLEVDDRQFTLPLARLSATDRQWLLDHGAALPSPPAPASDPGPAPAPSPSPAPVLASPDVHLIPIPGQSVRTWNFRDGRTLVGRLRAAGQGAAEFEPVGRRPVRVRVLDLTDDDRARVHAASAPSGTIIEAPAQGREADELEQLGFRSLEYRTQRFREHRTGFERQHIQFQLWAPEGVTGRPLPLVVFLHGIGEQGTDNVRQLKHRDPLVFISARSQQRYPCWFMAPQHGDEEIWQAHSANTPSVVMRRLHEAIRHLVLTEQQGSGIDWSRIYVTGLSSGAHGALDAVAKFPATFAAAVAISGAVPPERFHPDNVRPVWLFLNRGDHRAVVDGADALAAHLKALGLAPRMTTFDRGGHDAWSAAYDQSGLARWLFDQRQPLR